MIREPKQILTEWLVLGAKTGDESAFRDLHDLWRADLRRLILVRVERLDAAEEVLNDVWLDIARGLGRLDDPACFPRWAFRIVERRSTDWIRRQTRARRREMATAELAPAEIGNSAEPSDQLHTLRSALVRLSADQRKLVHLYYELECNVSEIAEVFAVPLGTIKSRLSTLRDTLKQLLNRSSHE